ncbi:MAG: AAA family ATPase [Flavisolibacter sp.]
MAEELFESRTDLSELKEAVSSVRQQISKVIVGQDEMVRLIIAALLADGHVLIEGVPGVAKTLTAKLVARSLSVDFSRIQFTPDLMPADLLGTTVFNPSETSFTFRRGPVFSNIVLIDEINRAPAKTQSALFEVMEERQVTVDGATHKMQAPFMVLATQNPIEQEGTYRLPEAQLDRFLFKIVVPYPTEEEEFRMLQQFHHLKDADPLTSIEPVLTPVQIQSLRRTVKEIRIEEHLLQFISRFVNATRNEKDIYLGGSPRASLSIMNAAKAVAAMNGRDFVTPEDITEVISPVLCHRIILSPEKEMEGVTEDTVLQQLLQTQEIPR